MTLSSMPDDFHHHFRDGDVCADVLRHASVRFGRAIAMPNLKVSRQSDVLESWREHRGKGGGGGGEFWGGFYQKRETQ